MAAFPIILKEFMSDIAGMRLQMQKVTGIIFPMSTEMAMMVWCSIHLDMECLILHLHRKLLLQRKKTES